MIGRNVYGLDLGTYEIKVFDLKKNEIWKEKNVIAMKDNTTVFASGDDAFAMYEKAPDDIQVVFPMQGGVIAHFDDMQYFNWSDNCRISPKRVRYFYTERLRLAFGFRPRPDLWNSQYEENPDQSGTRRNERTVGGMHRSDPRHV